VLQDVLQRCPRRDTRLAYTRRHKNNNLILANLQSHPTRTRVQVNKTCLHIVYEVYMVDK